MLLLEARGRRLAVEPVSLACCAVEVSAAVHGLPEIGPEGAAGADAWVLLVAGTVTAAGAEAVRARFAALPEPRRVVAFGACATSGGPYWDSYAVLPGVGAVVPVDVVVPGCPPPPSAVRAALEELAAHLPEPADARR